MPKDTIPVPPPAPVPNLAPGVIRVQGIITEIHALSDHRSGWFKLKVVQFLGMGSSAPMVSPGDTIKVQLNNPSSQIQQGTLFVMQLKHRHVLSKFKETAPIWRYIKGKRLKKENK